MLMKDGNHFNAGLSDEEIDGIGESLEQAAPDSRIDFRELKRIEPGTRQNATELIEKANSQADFLVFIPARSVADIKLGLRPKKDSSYHPWEFRGLSLFRISSRISSQGRPSEGLAS